MGTKRIDAHHHLWRYAPEEYGWIDEGMGVLRRDFLPQDLKPLLDDTRIDGAIAVQARQTLEETEWLLGLAEENPWIRGVVGWTPIRSPEFPEVLERLRQNPRLKGLRHVVQDEPDEEFILNEAFNRGIRAMRGTGLVYDILIYARHLPQAIRFVDMHPEQAFVLDHCAKPRIASGEMEPWRTQVRELAGRPHVCCKVSGLVTEADWGGWRPEGLRRYFDVVLEAFGPERLMFGSDWPVALLASGYQRWVETVEAWTAGFTAREQEGIWGGNAVRVYSL